MKEDLNSRSSIRLVGSQPTEAGQLHLTSISYPNLGPAERCPFSRLILLSHLQRDQRPRTGRVHGDAGPVQIQEIGDAIGDHAIRRAGTGVALRAPQIAHEDVAVVRGEGREINARRGTGETVGRNARIFQRLPGDPWLDTGGCVGEVKG